MGNITLSIVEIIILFASAIIVGVVIYFFISSRRNRYKEEEEEPKKAVSITIDESRIRLQNEVELKNKEIEDLRNRLFDAEENNKIYLIEIEETKLELKRLKSAAQQPQPEKLPASSRTDYFEQLLKAQQSLLEHNEKINQLLVQVDVIKETEEKSEEIRRSNEELNRQIRDLQYMVSEKEYEINQIKQKEHLTQEMTSMLDNAYSEFDMLQNKMRKLESQLASSKMVNIEYEDLKEAYYKTSRELEEARNKINHYMQENQNLQRVLAQTEEELSEAHHQRQQMQKKVSYLEELTSDLQQMSEVNKNLEVRLKRLGELESMFHTVSEERDKLRENQNTGL